jgi:hypothetical protein
MGDRLKAMLRRWRNWQLRPRADTQERRIRARENLPDFIPGIQVNLVFRDAEAELQGLLCGTAVDVVFEGDGCPGRHLDLRDCHGPARAVPGRAVLQAASAARTRRARTLRPICPGRAAMRPASPAAAAGHAGPAGTGPRRHRVLRRDQPCRGEGARCVPLCVGRPRSRRVVFSHPPSMLLVPAATRPRARALIGAPAGHCASAAGTRCPDRWLGIHTLAKEDA